MCYPHHVLSVRILNSLLWEGRLPLTHAPFHPLPLQESHSFTSHRSPWCDSPKSHSESLFFQESLTHQAKAAQIVFICAKHEWEIITKGQAFCRKVSGAGQLILTDPCGRTSPQREEEEEEMGVGRWTWHGSW